MIYSDEGWGPIPACRGQTGRGVQLNLITVGGSQWASQILHIECNVLWDNISRFRSSSTYSPSVQSFLDLGPHGPISASRCWWNATPTSTLEKSIRVHARSGANRIKLSYLNIAESSDRGAKVGWHYPSVDTTFLTTCNVDAYSWVRQYQGNWRPLWMKYTDGNRSFYIVRAGCARSSVLLFIYRACLLISSSLPIDNSPSYLPS